MLATLTKAHVRPLIDLNDQVNQLTSRESEINSTRIVVQGDQSHGKSSLLEALSGVDLPRGDDIKTRVPLIMQLRSCEDADQEHAFISRKGAEPERIALSEVAAKVDEFTEAIAGGSKGVKDEPIELKVFRRDQDDLTLIDLPGITRVGREGQGDGKQLEALILGMCKRYSAPPESVILNVVSAMVDFSTSASLQLSQELDPEGRRTLLCVTKSEHGLSLSHPPPCASPPPSPGALAALTALCRRSAPSQLISTRNPAWPRRSTSPLSRCASGRSMSSSCATASRRRTTHTCLCRAHESSRLNASAPIWSLSEAPKPPATAWA